MDEDKLIPISSGEVLLEEFLAPMNLTKDKVALALRIPLRHISEIIYGKRDITVDTVLRLARYFNMSSQFWLGLQTGYDLDVAEDTIGEQPTKEVAVLAIQES